ncbi:TrmH family RNA methyltransferase [Aestuariivivens sediminis]|uniref:TrmH family RNA methyltransferase n=1 Tax=Aestuariivivens sediminis TaxID=2913557 RepID=UPI001F588BEA|nr:RNA methyltransferase [Aestuariivivens sediminis]
MMDVALLNYLETYLTESRKEKFLNVLSQRTKHFTVAIEDVYQLHNTSAVMRSCDVFGIQELHVIEELNTKQIDREIAMGSQKWVDINRYRSVKDCLAHLRGQGYRIVATSPHVTHGELKDFDVTQKSCFFFGKETEGLSDDVLNAADGFIRIPMVGFAESLNISVSVAIILHDTMTRLKQTTTEWQLGEAEKLQKRMDWCKTTIKSYQRIIDRYYDAL